MISPRSIRLIALLIGSLIAARLAVAQTYSSGVINASISDLTTTQSSIHVTGGLVSIGRVTLHVNIRHEWAADLDLVLVPPQNDAYLHVCSDVGGGSSNLQATTFDAGASTRIISGGDGFPGRYRPEGGPILWNASHPIPATSLEGLQSLAGRAADGDWTLLIFDDAPGGEGTLVDWSLSFSGSGAPSAPRIECLASTIPARASSTFAINAVVSPGEFPASSSVNVTIDAHALGGGSVIAHDDGVEPDEHANDGVFAANVQVGSVAPGTYEVVARVADAQGRTAADSTLVRALPLPTADDSCLSPTIIISAQLPFVDSGLEVSGNVELNEASMNCAAGGSHNATRSRWFRFECMQSNSYVFTTDVPGTTAPDTVLALYEGVSCGDMRLVACDDDGAGLRSTIRTRLEQGSTYFIQAAPWSSVMSEAGAIAMSVREDPEVGACCLASGCAIVTRSACESQGGAYNGDGTICNPGSGPRWFAGSANFEDISAEGVELALGDDGVALVSMPFVAPTVVGAIESIYVSSNGFVSVQNPGPSFSNRALTLDDSITRICPLWDDLDASLGSVRNATRGIAGVDRRWIVQWTQVPQFATPSSSNTFQAVVFESGVIEYRYGAIDDFNALDVTVGVRAASGDVIVDVPSTNLANIGSIRIEASEGLPLCAPCAWIANGCGADYTGDGGVDGDDVIAFFADWDNAVPCADVDGTQSVDGDDVIVFFTQWDAGGC